MSHPDPYSYPLGLGGGDSTEESPFAQTMRELDEQFYATFPDAKRAAEQSGRLPYSKPVASYGTAFYYQPQPYHDNAYGQEGYSTEGYAVAPRDCTTAASSVETTLHYTYLTPGDIHQHTLQVGTSSQTQVQPNVLYSHAQQGSLQSPQYVTQSPLNDVPSLAWATPAAVAQSNHVPPNLQTFCQSPTVHSTSSHHVEQHMPSMTVPYSPTSYLNGVPPAAPAADYQEAAYRQPSLSVVPSQRVPQRQESEERLQHTPVHHSQPINRHERRSNSFPYPQTNVKANNRNSLPSPLTSPIRPAPSQPGHSRNSSTPIQSTITRSTTSAEPTWNTERSSPASTSSPSRATLPISPTSKRTVVEKKPPLACLFCRGRKIACGPPLPGSTDRTCNQCQRRCLRCEYPAESRRGMRKKKVTESGDGSSEQATSAPTPPTFPGEGTMEP